MNRSLELHTYSLVLGIAFSALVLLSMSQVPVLNARTINVQYMPDPRDCVQIHGGTPYVVPAGKLFVLTGVGNPSGLYNTGGMVWINGSPEVGAGSIGSGNGGIATYTSVLAVPLGFTVAAGNTIDVTPTGARAWGYLAPQ